MAERVTINEIARLAGVNISTVSRALSSGTAWKVSAAQREKILELCNKYNYRPRVAARGCATGKSFRIALILGAIASDLASPLQALYIRGVCSVLQASGYTLSILWAEEEPEKRDEVVRNFLMSEIADGYILGAPLLEPQTLKTFRDLHPILSFKTGQKDLENKFPTLELDPLASFKRIWRAMPRELADNIVFTGPDSGNAMRKKELFCSCSEKGRAVRSLFYPMDQEITAFHHDYLCARNFFSAHPESLLDARLICCSSDLVAHAACDELTARGRKVGEDIFVLGYDNIESSTPYPGKEPYLSTTDPHWEEAGRASAGFILDSLRDPGKGQPLATVTIEGSYVCRRSFPFDLPEGSTVVQE